MHRGSIITANQTRVVSRIFPRQVQDTLFITCDIDDDPAGLSLPSSANVEMNDYSIESLNIIWPSLTNFNQLQDNVLVGEYVLPVHISNPFNVQPQLYFVITGVIANQATLLTDTSYCWFAREKAVYHAGSNKSWIGQVHDDGSGYSQHIVELDHSDGSSVVTQVGTVVEYDDHNEPSILIRASDNRLFTCYAEHGASRNIRYRLSTNPLDGTAWGSETVKDIGAGSGNSDFYVTYPSCFEAPDGTIIIIYRETGNGWSYIISTDGGVTFGSRILFFYGEDFRGYLTFKQSADKNYIHFVGTGGHPNNDVAVDVYHFYMYLPTRNLFKSDGTAVDAFRPLTGDEGMTRVMDNVYPDSGWFEDIAIDGSGNPRILITYYPLGNRADFMRKDLYYSEWTGTEWTTPHKIHTAMTRSIKSTPGLDPIDTYPPNCCFDANDPDVIFASKEVDGICEIHKITRLSADNFLSEQLTFSSAVDQWRPFSVAASVRNCFWLNKISYPAFINTYDQDLIMATIL